MANNSLEITIRPYSPSDADDFLVYAGDEKVTKTTRLNTFTSKEEALSYIKNICIPHPYWRSICINGQSIGYVFIKPDQSSDDKCRAEMGYAVAANFWGQGIATRAAKMAISDGFKEFSDLVRIQGLVLVENKASQRVLDKLGFHREGLLRKFTFHKGIVEDVFMYSLLYTDFMPPTGKSAEILSKL